jgi:hypothetical protein
MDILLHVEIIQIEKDLSLVLLVRRMAVNVIERRMIALTV